MQPVRFRRTMALAVLATALHPQKNPAAFADEALHIRTRTISGAEIEVVAAQDASPQPALTVICFLGAECPMARLYGPRLQKIAEQFAARDVRVIGINSNRQDSFADVKRYVAELNITFPFIHDRGNIIADQLGATRTPEVFLLDNRMQVQYHGRIDDQYEPGVSRAAPKRDDLRLAIEELLAGKTVTIAETSALGCVIGRVENRAETVIVENDVTWSRHVVPVLQRHCMECHRAGEIGPFAMDSFGDVAGWADTMLETIENGRMPPWHANPEYGQFLNAREMPEADRQVIRDWIAGGKKEGRRSDLPPAFEYADDSQQKQSPDMVLEMRDRPFVVPADGVVEYQYFVVDPGFTEDKWVTEAQVIPGSRSVVHHAIVFIRPPDGARFQGVGWLSAYVPGQRLVALPPGCARRIPAGSKLVFQMHYTPNGTEQEDTTRVSLVFSEDDAVTHTAYTLIALNQEFEIPPQTSRHTVSARVPKLPKHGTLLAATPHMHVRGKSFRLFADTQKTRILLDVPHYDFNWQHTYALVEPLPLAEVEDLNFEVAFDNSDDNPFNPDADQWVTWGDQTWEEMAVAFFEISEPRKKPARTTTDSIPEDSDTDKVRQQKIDAYIARALDTMDRNRDGTISSKEAPIVVRHFNFRRFDLNGDGMATQEELRQVAEELY